MGLARSASISASARCCAAVSAKGRASWIVCRSFPSVRQGPSRTFLETLADDGERQLVGEKLVIGEARPGGRRKQQIVSALRGMQTRDRLGKAWPVLLGEKAGVDPLGQIGKLRQGSGEDFAEGGVREPRGQRINRLDQRQVTQPLRRRHMIGMRHLQVAVIGFELAGDEPLAADGQEPLEIGRIGLEVDKLERAGIVLDQNLVRRPPAAPSAAGPMLGHPDLERGQLSGARVGDSRNERPVDDPHRQMPQKIDGPGMGPLMTRRHQFIQQTLDARANAFQGAG